MKAWLRSVRAPAAAGLLLLGLTLLVYAPLLAPGRAPFSPYSDALAEHLALKQVAYSMWSAERQLPLWRDDQFSGAPALTNPQALYLHPLHAAFWVLPPTAAFGITLVLQFWVAGWGCYALARTLGAGWLASVFSGAAGTTAFKLVLAAQAGWLAPLATLALVPWLIAGLLRCAERPALSRTLQLAWIAAAACAGGSPQPLYYACVLTLPRFVSIRPTAMERTPFYNLRALLLTAAALGFGVMCNAYLWLPIASESAWLSRANFAGDYAYFMSGHALRWAQLGTLLQPSFANAGPEPWEEIAYFGLLPLGLAVVGAATARAGCVRRYAAYACAASVLLSLDTPILRAAYAVLPGYATFRLPGRMLFLTQYFGIGLAGPGLDRLLAMLPDAGDRAPRFRRFLPWGLAIALLIAVCVEGRQRAQAALTVIPSAEVLPDRTHPLFAPALHAMPRARSVVLGRRTLNYGWSAALELHLINGYDPYNYFHSAQYFELLRPGEPSRGPSNWFDVHSLARRDLLDELAVRYVISAVALDAPALTLVAHREDVRNFALYRGFVSGPLYVYENHAARPYARFAGAVQRVDSVQAAARRLAAEAATGQAYVIEPPTTSDASQLPAADPTARVQVLRANAGRIVLRARTATRQLLVVAETYHPGWRLRIDGRPSEPLQVNLALLGTWTDPGDHRIELEFVPLHFALGVALSILALGMLIGLSAGSLSAAQRARTALPLGRGA